MAAQEMAKQEQHSVEKTSNTEKTGVSKDKEKNKDANFGTRRKQRAATPEDEIEELLATPYTGILVNVKI